MTEADVGKSIFNVGIYKMLRAVLSGDYLSMKFRGDACKRLEKEVGNKNPWASIRKLEKAGIIVGYVPVLSEKGKKLYDSMVNMYESPDVSKLNDMMEKIE